MALGHSPPHSPLPTTSAANNNTPGAATLATSLPKSVTGSLVHSESVPDLPSMLLNLNDRKKKRKHEGEDEDNTLSIMQQMINKLAEDQEKRFNDLLSSIQIIANQNAELTSSVTLLSDKYDEFLQKISTLEAEKKEDRKLIKQLEDKLENIERKSRETGIELRCVPTSQNETKQDLCEIVKSLGSTLNVEIKSSDIKDIYRLKSKDSSNPIVTELNSVLLKEAIIKNARSFNKSKPKGQKLNTTHINLKAPPTPVYVSETLTYKAQRLFFLARSFQKNHKYEFCWTARGVVYLRKDEKSPLIKILDEDTIVELKKSA